MTDPLTASKPTSGLAIVGGTLIDGSGQAGQQRDVFIEQDRIADIVAPGTPLPTGCRRIDATGRIVAPGFIDVHTHDDNAVLTGPQMTAKISQGVTTVVTGNCGISLAPVSPIDPPAPMNLLGDRSAFKFPTMTAYGEAVDAARPAVNVAALVGHSTLRIGAMENLDRKANTRELDAMRAKLAEALDAGATGFSTGLWYAPNRAADMDEVVALAELAGEVGGVYATHMRDEHDGVLESLDESFETASRAGARLVISHHKCAGPRNWGRSKETLPKIRAARLGGKVSLDVYPYVAGSTVLEPEMVDISIRISVSWSIPHPEMAGRDLADIAKQWAISQPDAAAKLAPAGAIYFQIDEDDMRAILAYPPSMVGSDGLPNDSHPHPRLWGTFPRVLGRYCREEGLFPLELAVHKMSGLSAQNFGLADRGVLRRGARADVVIFDARTIADRATFAQPKQVATGIDRVIVNGVSTWTADGPTGERAGRFLRRPSV